MTGPKRGALGAFLQLTPGAELAMVEMCVLMFLWGLANNLNDILIKQFKKAFELGNLEAGLVQTALYIGYFVGAPPASLIANRRDYKTSILYGLGLYALGALLFLPSAYLRTYPLFLGSLLIIGFGLAALETSVSPYLIRLGPDATASRRINFAAVFNPCGSILGILGGKNFVFSGVEWSACSCDDVAEGGAECGLLVHLPSNSTSACPTGSTEAGCFVTPGSVGSMGSGGRTPTTAERVCSAQQLDLWREEAALATQAPYLLVAAAVMVTACLVHFTPFPRYQDSNAAAGQTPAPSIEEQMGLWLKKNRELLAGSKRFRNGVLAQFAYVGAQIGVWSYLIQYMQFNVADTSEKDAADHVFYSLLMLTVGRAVSTVLLRSIAPWKLMRHCAVINVGLMAIGIVGSGLSGTWAIVLSSFFMSLMFPTIFTIAIQGLDKDQTQLGSSLIVMSIIGGAVLTPMMGALADAVSINAAYSIPLLAFVVVGGYAHAEQEPELDNADTEVLLSMRDA